MKNFRTPVLCFSMMLFSLCSFAQNQTIPINEPDYNKPRLFDNLPDQIPVNIAKINELLTYTKGNPVDVVISNGSALRFTGTVVTAASKFQNKVVSVVLRSTNYVGASLTISKLTDDNGNISYTGRLLSFNNGDLFVLRQVNDNYVLVKRKYYDLVNE